MLIEIGSEVVRFALPTKSDDKVSIGFKLSEELRFSFRTFSLDKFTMEEVTSSYRPDNTRCYPRFKLRCLLVSLTVGRCRSRGAFILESKELKQRSRSHLSNSESQFISWKSEVKATWSNLDQFCLWTTPPALLHFLKLKIQN